jgi:hypothetical protein
MRRVAGAAVAILIGATTPLIAAPPAGAAQTVTASPSSGLTGGDVMRISGSGFHAGQTVTVYECVGTYQPPPGSTLDATQCDTAQTDTAQATAASDGSITATMFFQSPLFTGSIPKGYDCVNGCSVVADPFPKVDALTSVKGDNACNGNTGSAFAPLNKSVSVHGVSHLSDLAD